MEQTLQALDDPMATTVRLDLARRHLGLFFYDTNAHDYALIARIVADDRVRDIDTPIRNAFSKDKTPAAIVNAWYRNIIAWWLLLPQSVLGAIKRRGVYC